MRINTTLQESLLQKRSEAVLFLVVCSILIFSDMSTWGKSFALILLCIFAAYQRLLQKPTPRIVQLIQFDKETWRWLVREPNKNKKISVSNGRLISVHGGWFVLVLHFESIEKNQVVTESWIIWRDQVDSHDWRRLIIIARFWANDSSKVNHS
ncbi:MAG: hypothetical protein H7Z73_09970 [Candidatus Saccharibacteria bacterium]|nr:hypothetical protein [Moraxellaceae bacterium]